ncbi:Lipoprotein of type IV secretion complex that spans outer membrane and periplasm (VirB7) (plasmid) [Sinorhizobium fredii CCBAU 25509]|nr:Lipoprotein of type IV secretion complex that spans outer membrane and periplasm (VirB7) [Sinorhizobium fredii CCBAU 25509]
MWQWEDNSKLKQKDSDARPATSSGMAAAYAEEGKEPPRVAHLDVDASYRSCEG